MIDYNAPCDRRGKFEGERKALQIAYENSLDGGCDDFGDVDGFGYYCASFYKDENIGADINVWFVVNSQGFVTEISESEYNAAEVEYEAMLEEEEGDE